MIGSTIIREHRSSGHVPSMPGPPRKVETPTRRSLAGKAVDAVVAQTAEGSSRPEATPIHSTDSRNLSGPTTAVAYASPPFAGASTLSLAH